MRRPFIPVLLSAMLLSSSSARAEEWVYQDEDVDDRAGALLRFQARFNIWVATFRRPDSACQNDFGPVIVRPLRVAQNPFGFGCVNSDSSEIALGTGVEVMFRLFTPLHVTIGVDVLYSEPSDDFIRNQILIAIPFGLLFTVHEWSIRPILHPTVTPVLYLTDDARDYLLGVDAGFAWRILDWGDLSFTLGYQGAETAESWQMQFGVHPL